MALLSISGSTTSTANSRPPPCKGLCVLVCWRDMCVCAARLWVCSCASLSLSLSFSLCLSVSLSLSLSLFPPCFRNILSKHADLVSAGARQEIRQMIENKRMLIGAFHVLGHGTQCQRTLNIATTPQAGMSSGEEAESVNSMIVAASASLRKMRCVLRLGFIACSSSYPTSSPCYGQLCPLDR